MQGDMFGATFSLGTAGVADLPRDMLIPGQYNIGGEGPAYDGKHWKPFVNLKRCFVALVGVAVFSRRSLPLAAWTNGLDIATVKADVERSCLILETGVNQRWRYGGWKASPDSIEEARGWEDCKDGVK